MTLPMLTAKKLAELLNNGATQVEIAKMYGVAQSTVSRWVSRLLYRPYLPVSNYDEVPTSVLKK